MPAFNVTDMLPKQFAATPLATELVDDLQYVVDKADVLEYVINAKYTDPAATQAVIDELGLGYLFDLMAETGTPTANIRAFVSALHAHKGTRYGLELLLNLMGLTGLIGTAKVTEWWEDTLTPLAVAPAAQRLTPNTYKVRITLASGATTPVKIFQAFNVMSPKYVLPALDIGTVFKGAATPFIQAMGRPVYVYYANATDTQQPIIHFQAIGKANTTVAAAATI